MHLFGRYSIMITSSNSSVKRSGLIAAKDLGDQGITSKSVPKFQLSLGARQRGDYVGLPRCVGQQTFFQFGKCDRLNSESRRYFHVEAARYISALPRSLFRIAAVSS
jgi:uncharacterized ParB-like nuclease family protein